MDIIGTLVNADVMKPWVKDEDILTPTPTSTTTHLLATLNISTQVGPNQGGSGIEKKYAMLTFFVRPVWLD